MNNFTAIEHAKCLIVLQEVTAYEKTTSGISVCVYECVFIRVSTEQLLRHVLLQVNTVTWEWFCVHVITYINTTTTTLHMTYLLNVTFQQVP